MRTTLREAVKVIALLGLMYSVLLGLVWWLGVTRGREHREYCWERYAEVRTYQDSMLVAAASSCVPERDPVRTLQTWPHP